MRVLSKSIDETIAIGEKLAKKLKRGSVVALIGDLGSGKTVFTKGIAKGLGVKNSRYVNSPTFVIIKEYKGRLPLYHFDLYRLNSSSILDIENFEEYFYGDGVTVVEWADKASQYLPSEHVEVRMKVIGDGEREIEIRK
jgi:tRNA threonylcarbamoyladenosine biosynthesis protein TsaE